uniref:Uncharacterized protein n=1 Tax=Vitis vinifera TaxID=29760 RepID=A5B1N6_VITVI|nr:hypothetical protein VITISV_006098 [Vitis vinifera]
MKPNLNLKGNQGRNVELDKPLNQSLQSGLEKVSYTSSSRPSRNYYGALELNLKICAKGTKLRVYRVIGNTYRDSWDGLPMQGQDSATILSMFHDILDKETPFVVLMVTKGWRIGQVEAVRPLHGWAEGNDLLRQSLQPGAVPSSSPSPCTHIPRQSGGRCALNEINVAVRVGLAPPAFPNFVIDVVVASVAKDSHAQDRSS